MEGKILLTVENIAERYGHEMRNRARRILMSDSDAEDAVQETLLTIINAPHMLSGIERIGAWLLTLVTRRSIDIIRKNSVRKLKEHAVIENEQKNHPDPGTIMDRDEAAKIMHDAIQKLPEKYRIVFIKSALDGITFEEMSKDMCVPIGTLLARKKRAQDKLRAALRKKGFAL